MSSNAPKYTSQLRDARVLVIGGTSGIGFCVAEAAVEYGAHVTVASSNPSRVSTAVSRLKASSTSSSTTADRVQGFPCDLGDPSTLKSNLDALLRSATSDRAHPLDHIVFTAGDLVTTAALPDADVPDIQAASTVRLYGSLMLGSLAPAYMTPGSTSSITLTGGVNSHRPAPGWAIRATLGSAAEGAMRGLAVDLAPLRVNLVSPGAVNTELFAHFPEAMQKAVLQRYTEMSLVKKVAAPEEVAHAYLYSMLCTFCTGTVVGSDGGFFLK